MTEPFVQVPRSLFDAIARAKLPGSETRIALYLLGQSIGWQRTETSTYGSIAAISEATSCGRRTAIQSLQSLCARGLVVCVYKGGPGRGPSSYKLAPASDWIVTSEQDRTSAKDRTSKTHPVSEQDRTSEKMRTSEQGRTIGSEWDRTTGSEQECTLRKKTKRRGKEYFPPKAPQGAKTWTADKLYFQLGGRGTIPPFVQSKWLSISERSDEDLEAALARVTNFANPRARFLEQFDDEGADISPGWAEAKQGKKKKTWTAESLWAEMQAEDAAKAAKEATCKA